MSEARTRQLMRTGMRRDLWELWRGRLKGTRRERRKAWAKGFATLWRTPQLREETAIVTKEIFE